MDNLTIIGSSHIAKQSIKEIRDFILKNKPDFIALELDKKRYFSLIKPGKRKLGFYDFRRIGIKGFIFALIGNWVENKLGKYVGVKPGDEMKEAIKQAKKVDAKLAFIDQDIEVTLRRFSKTLTWKEKWNFVADIVKAIIFRKKEIDFDLSKVPSKKIIKKMIDKVKVRYPNIYHVLVEERNRVMVKKLENLIAKFPDKKVLAIVGAGHEEGMKELLRKRDTISYSFSVG